MINNLMLAIEMAGLNKLLYNIFFVAGGVVLMIFCFAKGRI